MFLESISGIIADFGVFLLLSFILGAYVKAPRDRRKFVLIIGVMGVLFYVYVEKYYFNISTPIIDFLTNPVSIVVLLFLLLVAMFYRESSSSSRTHGEHGTVVYR